MALCCIFCPKSINNSGFMPSTFGRSCHVTGLVKKGVKAGSFGLKILHHLSFRPKIFALFAPASP